MTMNNDHDYYDLIDVLIRTHNIPHTYVTHIHVITTNQLNYTVRSGLHLGTLHHGESVALASGQCL